MRVHIGKYPKGEEPRKVSVKLDRWDTWSMDHTLALIIHPMLVQLKEQKHGAPWTDDEDVPEHLRSTAAPPKENDWDTDDNHFKRWDWVLDEMVWVMSTLIEDDDTSHYYVPYEEGEVPEPIMASVPNDDGSFTEKEIISTSDMLRMGKMDSEKREAYFDRQKHALFLFGKYFRSLWT